MITTIASIVPALARGAEEEYVTEEVRSTRLCLVVPEKRRKREEHTGDEVGRNSVEHVGVHVCVHDPVGRCVVACGDEHRVTLCDGNVHKVDGRFLDIGLRGRFSMCSDTYQRSR